MRSSVITDSSIESDPHQRKSKYDVVTNHIKFDDSEGGRVKTTATNPASSSILNNFKLFEILL